MNKHHLAPVAVLAAVPCLVLAATAPATAVNGTGPLAETEPLVSPPLVAWADFDGDGLVDAFAVHPNGAGVLYRGAAAGQLVLAADDLGLSALPALRAAAWEDANSDGRPDLLVLFAAGGGRLFVNDGFGFADATVLSGLELDGVLAARWSDHDGDGDADLVTGTAGGYRVHHNLGHGLFENVELAAPPVPPLVAPLAGALTLPGGPAPGSSATSGTTEVAGSASPSPTTSATLDLDRRDFVQPGVGTQSRIGQPTRIASQPLTLCAPGIQDQAGASCISASTTPTLGLLHPLGTNFNIDSGGRVGIGTTVPTSKLEINSSGSERALEAWSIGDVTTAFLSSGGVLNPTLQVRSAKLAATLEGRLEQGLVSGLPPTFKRRVVLDAEDAGHGRVSVKNTSGQDGIKLRAGGVGTFGAVMEMLNTTGVETVALGAASSSNGGYFFLDQSSGANTFGVQARDILTPGSSLSMSTSAGVRTVELLSEEAAGNGAQLALGLANGTQTIILDAHLGSVSAELSMRNLAGIETVQLRSEEVAGNGAQLVLRKANGTASIVLDAEQNGDGRIITQVLEITGGADLAESFDTGEVACAPGSVVVIDPDRPGALMLAREPYDSRVAGVVSGAGDVRPGLHMGQAGVASGDTPVALTGRVQVLCTSENGAVRPGDLLTTSSTPGHAMRASDAERVFGAVIGKAMSALDEGETGLVLVLVNLQ